jgi:hypothetical protein
MPILPFIRGGERGNASDFLAFSIHRMDLLSSLVLKIQVGESNGSFTLIDTLRNLVLLLVLDSAPLE